MKWLVYKLLKEKLKKENNRKSVRVQFTSHILESAGKIT